LQRDEEVHEDSQVSLTAEAFESKVKQALQVGILMTSNALSKGAIRGVFFSQWAYWWSLVIAALSVSYIPPGSLRNAVMLVPVLTTTLCVAVAYWLYQACDEFVRLKLLKGATFTAVVIAVCSLGYFFLELLGLPRLSMVWVGVLGWGTFSLQLLLVVHRSQRA
jgi:hypothetical protein